MSPPPSSANLQGFNIPGPQTPDPLQTLAQMQEMRTRNLQQQQAQMGLQEHAMQLRSNQAMMRAFAQGNGDWPTTQKLLDSSPDILPADRMGVEQHRIQLQQAAATLTEAQHKNYQWNADQYRAELDAAADLISKGNNPQDALNQANLRAERAGVSFADPNAPAGSSTGVEQLTTYPGDLDHLKAFSAGIGLKSQQVEEALKGAQAGEATARGAQAEAEAAKAKVETAKTQKQLDFLANFAKNPQNLQTMVGNSINQAQYPELYARAFNQAQIAANMGDINGVLDAIKSNAALASEQEKSKFLETDPQIRTAKIQDAITKETDPRVIMAALAKSPELNLTVPGLGGGPNAPGGAGSITPSELTGDAYLQSLPPNTAGLIKAIADGRITLDSVGRNQVARQQLQQAVMQYDRSWSEQRAALRSAFTTGPEAVNIGNLNTGTVHAQQFLEAAKAMQNFTFRPGNAAWNAMSRLFGSAIPTNLEAIKNAWAGEMASALKGTATDPEIASIKKGIDDVNSWDQFQGVVNENLKALGAKLNTYHQRAQQQNLGDWSPILPSAREVFRQHGMDPTREDPTKTGGGGGAGPVKGATRTYQGHTYQFDGQKWVRQ